MNTSETRRPTLMVVHAHPDDEAGQTGGTLARYAAAGVRTVLVTCTDGGQGDGVDGREPGHHDHRPEEVAARRAHELAMSGAALGVSHLIRLDHPDSGLPDFPDDVDPRAFSRVDGEPVVRQLEALMREYRPDVLVTYPPDGLSNHPDHVRTHDLTTAAFERIRTAGGFLVQAGADARPGRRLPKLYHIALSVSRLAAVRTLVRASLGPDAWTPPLGMGVDDDDVTTVVDVSAFWEQKLRALAAHASQSDARALLGMLRLAGRENAVEEYVRADPPWTGGERETDLFQDVVEGD
ncbi:PIG-L deacetylase family protein [Streptomyces sp. NPDC057950]|uniref:PIG-L deacetylase family protein n=1 Tax=Streptomyces sp. NPDC057950 TaxID=3346288 RepID=UPI0036E4B812